MDSNTYHEHTQIKLLGHGCCTTKKRAKSLLSFRQFTTSNEFCSIQRHDAIDNQETILVGGEVGSESFQQVKLHLGDVRRGFSFTPIVDSLRYAVLERRRCSHRLDLDRLGCSVDEQALKTMSYLRSVLQFLEFFQVGMYPRYL